MSQTQDLRSVKHFRTAWLFFIDIWQFRLAWEFSAAGHLMFSTLFPVTGFIVTAYFYFVCYKTEIPSKCLINMIWKPNFCRENYLLVYTHAYFTNFKMFYLPCHGCHLFLEFHVLNYLVLIISCRNLLLPPSRPLSCHHFLSLSIIDSLAFPTCKFHTL